MPSPQTTARALLPSTRRPAMEAPRRRLTHALLDDLDAIVLLVRATGARDELARLPFGELLVGRLAAARRRAGDRFLCVLPSRGQTTVSVGLVAEDTAPFALLELARTCVKAIPMAEVHGLGLATTGLPAALERAAIEAGAAAAWAASFRLPEFKSKPATRGKLTRLVPVTRLSFDAARAAAVAEGTDLARWLTSMPPDRLNPGGFRRAAQALARRHGLQATFHDEAGLRRLGAGAFLAVSRGSARRDAGILHLRYRPRGAKRGTRPIALVGKGLCFDTGGTNLKSHKSMLDMHTDMGGSAVALATLVTLARLRYPRPVDAWLALAENRIGPEAYQPQDVVTAMDGTTIQVIHTDAEGRMVLADTLALASRSRAAAIIDFATLTGACVVALTERYSGAFSNRPDWREPVERAGHDSGERVWFMPMDEDFDHDLESKVADVVQCTVEGKGDHIYAARFLRRFVGKGIPWLHVDLSAATHSGGLAHIPTEVTGFGVRLTSALLLDDRLPGA